MAWFKVDDGFHSSRKLLSIPRRHRLAAAGLWVIAGSWCADEGTDGLVPEYMLKEWGATAAVVKALVDSGLWEHVGDTLAFYSWLEYQPSKAQVASDRAASKARMRAVRASRKEANRHDSAASGELFGRTTPHGSESVRDPVPSRPDHVSKDTSIDRQPKAINRPLPKDWKPTPEHQERAFEYGLDIGREQIKFQSHAEEKGRLAKNWNAAFTRWLTNAKEYQTRSPSGGGFSRPSIDRQGDLLKAEAARIQAKYENQQPRLEIEP